jgi:hypothetical protein
MLIGFLDSATRDKVEGWALDATSPGKTLIIRVVANGEERFRGAAERPRPDLESVYRSSKHGFKILLEPPLPANELCQILICGDSTNEILATKTLPPITHGQPRSAVLQPAFVTFSGRSGSTILMKMLSVSAEIVVAGSYPFEVMLAGYYAQAYSVLTRPGDHARSCNPSNIWEDIFRVGANPFHHPQYSRILNDHNALYDILGRCAKDRLRDAVRDTILDVYKTIVKSDEKSRARCFAEKCTLHSAIREAIKCIFDAPKEIVLVRDLRDIFCSSKAFWSVSSDFINTISEVRDAYLQIMREAGPATLIVRYEDLVMDRGRTAQIIAAFLGLSDPLRLDADAEADLFQKHGTSADPKASVGRWKRDLAPEERAMFTKGFGDFFRAYGYEV